MRAVADGATLAGGVRVLALLLAAYLVLGQPAVGFWSARRQHRATDPGARRRRYRRTVILEWSLVAVVHGHCIFAINGTFALLGEPDPEGAALARVRDALRAPS